MGSAIPNIDPAAFRQALRAVVDPQVLPRLDEPAFEAFAAHYRELVRWNPRLSLVGPGTGPELVSRHWGESLAALSLFLEDPLPSNAVVVDLGSGGGFPGFPLAVAGASSDLLTVDREATMVFVEPKTKKCAFLEAVFRRSREVVSSLSCRILDARVDPPFDASLDALGLPRLDLLISRALALDPRFLEMLFERHPSARVLLWIGRDLPSLAAGIRHRQTVHLPGSDHRRIVELVSSSGSHS